MMKMSGERVRMSEIQKAYYSSLWQHLFLLLYFIFSFTSILPQLLIMLTMNLIKHKQVLWHNVLPSPSQVKIRPPDKHHWHANSIQMPIHR